MISPIEKESFRRLQSEINVSHLNRDAAEVAARIVHATGDPDIVDDLIFAEDVIERLQWGLRHQVPIIVDVRMLAAGLTKLEPLIAIEAARQRTGPGETRSHNGMIELLRSTEGSNPIIAIGSAPTALRAVLERARTTQPLAVIGLPVGFVDAAESKADLVRSGLPAITNRSRRGGSPMAAAALNAVHLITQGEYRLDR